MTNEKRNVSKVIGTPYDDVYRTLINDCRQLIIPVVNEVFQEHYAGDEPIVPAPNEHFLNRQDGREIERITDSSFAIASKRYHLECQCRPDGSMLIRMFEYDSQIALDDAVVEGYTMTIPFPRSAVLFLRHDRNTPDCMAVTIRTEGGDVSYKIPVIKLQEYSLEEIFRKKLLFFVPFYIFLYEKEFANMEEQEEKMARLKAEYGSIRRWLDALCEAGELTVLDKRIIIDMSRKVLDHITAGHPAVREGVNTVMGGKVLDYEAKDILKQGIEQGIEQGIAQGIEQIALKMIRKGAGDEEIQEMTDLPVTQIEKLRRENAIGK